MGPAEPPMAHTVDVTSPKKNINILESRSGLLFSSLAFLFFLEGVKFSVSMGKILL